MKRNITLKDIAKQIGVSPATVDRAIHDRADINEDTREKILNAIKELGYKPNKIARTLVSRKTVKVGLILPLDPSFFWSEVERGIKFGEEGFKDFGIKMSSYRIRYSTPIQKYTIDKLMNDGVCAIIIKPIYDIEIIEKLNECIEKGIKVITINDDIKEVKKFFYVGSNDEEAGRTAAQLMSVFLGGKGTVAIVRDYDNKSYSLEQRYVTFKEYMSKECPNIAVVDDSIQQFKKIGEYNAYLMTKDYIENVSNLSGIYNDSGTIYEVALAVKDENLDRKIVLVGHEVSPEINGLVEEGYIDGIITQDPFSQGFHTMKVLCDYLIDNIEPKFVEYMAHIDIVLKSNLRYQKGI